MTESMSIHSILRTSLTYPLLSSHSHSEGTKHGNHVMYTVRIPWIETALSGWRRT